MMKNKFKGVNKWMYKIHVPVGLQRLAKVLVRGLVKFFPPLA